MSAEYGFSEPCLCRGVIPPYMSDRILKYYQAQGSPYVEAFAAQVASNTFAANIAKVMSGAYTPQAKRTSVLVDVSKTPSRFEVWDASNLSKVTLISEKDAKAAAEAITCYKSMRTTDQLFRARFNAHVLRDPNRGLRAFTNHPNARNNAFWLPITESIYFGTSDPNLFTSFVHLDIVAHELTHGFTEFTARFRYEGQSGALNESISDVFAIMTKHHEQQTKVDQANWLIGDGLVANDPKHGTALRSMAAPGTAFRNHKVLTSDQQVGHMNKYQRTKDDHGGVHLNSGIPNRAFYLAAMSSGGYSWERVGQIWFKAVLLSQPDDKFAAFARNTLVAAKDFPDGVVNLVGKAWADVGVIPKTLSSKL